MDDLTIDRALQLARSRDGHHVSLFMPTRTFVPGSQEEDTTRLRNLLRQAAEDLVARGARPAQVEALLAPARALIDDRPFWLRAEHGLALFIGPEGMHAFRLPARVTESVHVGDRYHIRPLLPHVDSRGEYWLLFISQKKVRLYSGSREGLAQVPAAGLPSSLGEALRWDDFEKASLQFHVNTSAAGGRGTPIYHGTSDPDIKSELARFFRQIDRALRERLRDSRAPLVLAGVDYLIPIYRDVNTYPHLTGDAVIGNADIVPLSELHKKAVAIVRGLAEWETRQLANRVEEAWGSPKTTPDLETIVTAAFAGRVDTLFLTDGSQSWGTYDAEAVRVVVHRTPAPGDEDLLDLAALQTLDNGGAVVSLPREEMPHRQTAVALLRY